MPQGFDWLADIIRRDKIETNFATLNHDRLLEAFFRKNNLLFDDGFYDFGDHDRFDGYRLHVSAERKLLKLHGSIDWRSCGGSLSYHVARLRDPSVGNNDHILHEGTQPHPEIVIGTYNKLEEYLSLIHI